MLAFIVEFSGIIILTNASIRERKTALEGVWRHLQIYLRFLSPFSYPWTREVSEGGIENMKVRNKRSKGSMNHLIPDPLDLMLYLMKL